MIIRSRKIEEPKGTLPADGQWVVLTEDELRDLVKELEAQGVELDITIPFDD